MKLAKAIALVGLLAMTGVLIYGFTVGNFAAEGKELLSMPWGIVSLVAVTSATGVFRFPSLLKVCRGGAR